MDLKYLNAALNDSRFVGADFPYKFPGIVIPYVTFTTGFAIIGTIGNILVIGSIIFSKDLRTLGNCFLMNLAIADLCVSFFVSPMSVYGLYKGEIYFLINHELCTFIASVCFTACVCSINSIGAVSINRYIFIVHNNYYRRIYTKITTPLMCVGLWILSFMMHFPTLVGWGGTGYDKKDLSCIWDRLASRSYTIFFAVVPVGIPVSITAFCYFRIFYFYREHAKRLTNSNAPACFSQTQKKAIHLARTLFVIYFVFILSWSPYTLVVLIDEYDVLPVNVHVTTIVIAHINSSINCIIYAVTNPSFRKGYVGLVTCSIVKQRVRVGTSTQLEESNKQRNREH